MEEDDDDDDDGYTGVQPCGQEEKCTFRMGHLFRHDEPKQSSISKWNMA